MANTNLSFGFDTQNPNRSLLKTNYYQYQNDSKYYILYPSMGGINIDQSVYECTDTANTLKKELNDNNAVHNGAVRSLWGASHFGYFDNSLIKKPKPNEYLKVINVNNSEQNAFDIINTESSYSQIDEILSVFNTELLDKFETTFLTFCDYKPTAESLILKGEINKPSYTDPFKLNNLLNRRLINKVASIFYVPKVGVSLVNENVDGMLLGKKQINTFLNSVTEFLNFDCVVKNSNPGNYDRKLL